MAPQKPSLPPLRTPKNIPFPSELYDSPISESSDSPKHEENNTASITPPAAYTEFLNTFTPVFGNQKNRGEEFPKQASTDRKPPSPVSIPASASSVSFSAGLEPRTTSTTTIQTSSSASTPQSTTAPGQPRRLRIPSLLYSPPTCSPSSAYTIRSPYSPFEQRRRQFESPRGANDDAFSVREVVTRTVTYRAPPALNPPPKGKRKRTSENRNP